MTGRIHQRLELKETDNRGTDCTMLILEDSRGRTYDVEINPMYMLYNALENLGLSEMDLLTIEEFIGEITSKYED